MLSCTLGHKHINTYIGCIYSYTEKLYMHTHTHTHTHIYIYIYIYVFIFIYETGKYKWWFTVVTWFVTVHSIQDRIIFWLDIEI